MGSIVVVELNQDEWRGSVIDKHAGDSVTIHLDERLEK